MKGIMKTPIPISVHSTIVDYSPPLYLKHRPIYMLPYAPFDYAGKETDAKYFSIGIPQYPLEKGENDISVKVWRYDEKNEKWHRMSEEIPLQREIDLCIFAILAYCANGEELKVPKNTFENQAEDIILLSSQTGERDKLIEYKQENNDEMRRKLEQLARILKDHGYLPD